MISRQLINVILNDPIFLETLVLVRMSVDWKHALRHVSCLANLSGMQAAKWRHFRPGGPWMLGFGKLLVSVPNCPNCLRLSTR